MIARQDLRAALAPRSIAVIGASDNPHKVGGRPILYSQRHGFRGAIYPVNPVRSEVQGLKAWPDIASLPEAPDLAVVAVAGEEALRAVEACAARGVKIAVVMTSGFGETDARGRALQERMREVARAAGMRLVGPNCQGLANFATGAVANFSTAFHEVEPQDGPVAIVSQSGACSQAIYLLAREKGLAVRHVHATGNEADVTVAELAAEVVRDPEVRLLLLYLEAIRDPEVLAAAAEAARARDLPVVAVKAGRTAGGQRAAQSHTGALASEDRVVDAFFERHGIWRAEDPHELVRAGALYLKGWRPRRGRLVVVSNSGASCVMAADAAEGLGLPLASFSDAERGRIAAQLPGFAAAANPIDVTGALLGSPDMFARLLPALKGAGEADVLLAAFPILGEGYNTAGFARDFAAYAQASGSAVAIASPQAGVRVEFARAGLPVFAREREGLEALAQLVGHAARMRAAAPPPPGPGMQIRLPSGKGRFLDEAQSLAVLAQAGMAVVEHRLCLDADGVRAAFAALGPRVALKACSADTPHKSELGLVALGIDREEAAVAEFERQRAKLRELGAESGGILVARMAARGRELALGARIDPQFGPVVLVGDGGIYLEALKDFSLLLPPFDVMAVKVALGRLRIAPLLAGVRGEAPRDLDAVADMAVRLGRLILSVREEVVSIDVNPVMVLEEGRGACALDALIERR